MEDLAREQVKALPAGALIPLAEIMTVLGIGPWSGDLLNARNPDANMCTHAFGDRGLITYLIVEDQRRVLVTNVVWAG